MSGMKFSLKGQLVNYWRDKERKAEERKEFLYTLLRQDLRSKCQTIQGYLQLLGEVNIPNEQREYLRKAVEAGEEVDEILELASKLENIEETEWIAGKNIVKVLGHVTDDTTDLAEREGVEIKEDYPESVGKVKGDHSLNTLFSQILKARIKTTKCNKIKISTGKKNGKTLVKIEDDGERLPEDIKDLFTGEVYTGKTTGAGGTRYHIIRQIAEHNNAEIEVKGSELGGARFDVHLRKVREGSRQPEKPGAC